MADGLGGAPDGFALLCRTCRWRPAENLPMGIVQAHFQTEHRTDAVNLELVALCPRCDQPMRFDHSRGNDDVFECDPCHRTRVVKRDGPHGYVPILTARDVDQAEALIDTVFVPKAPGVEPSHRYWSTHCRHGNHKACSATEMSGRNVQDREGWSATIARRPAQCKTCAAPCVCTCHQEGATG